MFNERPTPERQNRSADLDLVRQHKGGESDTFLPREIRNLDKKIADQTVKVNNLEALLKTGELSRGNYNIALGQLLKFESERNRLLAEHKNKA